MMTMLRRVLHRPAPVRPDPAHEEFVRRMEEGRALGLRATRDARHHIRRLQRDAGLDNDTLNESVFGRPRPSRERKKPE